MFLESYTWDKSLVSECLIVSTPVRIDEKVTFLPDYVTKNSKRVQFLGKLEYYFDTYESGLFTCYLYFLFFNTH